MIIREEEFINKTSKPSLLLHVCCAPCASYVIEYLKDMFDVTFFFFNPNIMPEQEYEKRFEEVLKLADIYGVKTIKGEYDNDLYLKTVSGLEKEVEGSTRCFKCYNLRLIETKKQAEPFDYFATTLTVSPYKNSKKVNEFGVTLGEKYLESNFKKREGYKKSIELSKKYDLYRQDYCGCIFSKRID